MASREIARLEPLIVTVRGERVILASDLARIYGVEARALNQAVKRNPNRFPADFAFRLRFREARELARSRSQSVILKRGRNVKYVPLAFTEHGAVMAANVLNSARAVEMSVFVVRAFVRLRHWTNSYVVLARKLGELEKRVSWHDEELGQVLGALRRLLGSSAKPRRQIGFGSGA